MHVPTQIYNKIYILETAAFATQLVTTALALLDFDDLEKLQLSIYVMVIKVICVVTGLSMVLGYDMVVFDSWGHP